jgi:small subunit ribosomal protein S20
MPILKNAKKALRQSEKREAENKVVKKAYKEALKNAKKAVESGAQDLKEQVVLAQKKLAKAVKKGVMEPNTAARYTSKLMKKAQEVAKK